MVYGNISPEYGGTGVGTSYASGANLLNFFLDLICFALFDQKGDGFAIAFSCRTAELQPDPVRALHLRNRGRGLGLEPSFNLRRL